MTDYNPLKQLASILSSEYVPFLDIAVPVGFHLKLAGIEWRTDQDLASIMVELVHSGFLQVLARDPSMVRLNPVHLPESRRLMQS